MEILLGALIVLFSGFVQGLTGFGFSLIAVPFFLKVYPFRESVPLVAILFLVTNLLIVFSCIKYIDIKKFRLLFLTSIVFVPIGSYSLLYINPAYLKIVFGIIVLFFSVLLFFKKAIPIKNEKIGYAVTGSLSGFLSGSLAIGGPPAVIFLSNQGIEKNVFRANLTFFLLILNSLSIGTHVVNGLLDSVIFGRILYLIPSLLIGVFLGIMLSKKVNEAVFKRITLILLFFTGLWTIIYAIITLV